MHVKDKEISLFLDNRLDEKRRKSLEEHFSVCRKCRDKLLGWKELYYFLGELECDFELDGLENKIMQRIKTAMSVNDNNHEDFRIPVPALICITFVAAIFSLLFEPVINFIDRFYSKTMVFMLNESLELINSAKWEAVDAIEMLKSMEMTGLAACGVLIAGGIYYTVNRKTLRKV